MTLRAKEREGIGVEQSDLETVRLLYESAGSGCPEAMCEIGFLYETGAFEAVDYEMAFYWYEQAVELDSAEGYYREANCYKNAVDPELFLPDERAASWCMNKAAEMGYEPAYEALVQMARDGYGIFDDSIKAAAVIDRYAAME